MQNKPVTAAASMGGQQQCNLDQAVRTIIAMSGGAGEAEIGGIIARTIDLQTIGAMMDTLKIVGSSNRRRHKKNWLNYMMASIPL